MYDKTHREGRRHTRGQLTRQATESPYPTRTSICSWDKMTEADEGGRVTSWEETMTALVRDHGDRLQRTAYLLCGDRHAAQDLVQEAFVRVLTRRRSRVEVARELEAHEAEAYLRRTILNLYLDGYRRRRRWNGVRHLVARPDSVESDVANVERRMDATRALAQLPPQVRACMVLHYYDDLPVAQVAIELGLAEGSVKRYLSDGRAILSTALADPIDDSTPGGTR